MKNHLLGTVSLIALFGSIDAPAKADGCSSGTTLNNYVCTGLITAPENLTANGGNLSVDLSGVVTTGAAFSGSNLFTLNGNGFDIDYVGGDAGTILGGASSNVIYATTSDSGSITITNPEGNLLDIAQASGFGSLISAFASNGSVEIMNEGQITGTIDAGGWNGISGTSALSLSAINGSQGSITISAPTGTTVGPSVLTNLFGVSSFVPSGTVSAENRGNVSIYSETANFSSGNGSQLLGAGIYAGLSTGTSTPPRVAHTLNSGVIEVRNGSVTAEGSLGFGSSAVTQRTVILDTFA
jgi:hypothetical protein